MKNLMDLRDRRTERVRLRKQRNPLETENLLVSNSEEEEEDTKRVNTGVEILSGNKKRERRDIIYKSVDDSGSSRL